jgi:transposase
MISNHLSLVEQLRPASNELAAMTAQYLAMGGEIHSGPDFGHRQTAISLHYPPDFQRAAVKEESNELADKVRKLAETMTIDEVMAETGISRGTLRGMSKRHRIKFKRAAGKWTAPNKVNGEVEEKYVQQIRQCLDQQMTQNKARQHIGISAKLFKRLILDHGIPYPVVTY